MAHVTGPYFANKTSLWFYKIDGKQEKLCKGTNDEQGRKIAEQLFEPIRQQHLPDAREQAKQKPISEMLAIYKREYFPAVLSDKFKQRNAVIEKFLQEFGNLPLGELTGEDFDKFFENHPDWKGSTRTKYRSHLNTVFKSKLFTRILGFNPVSESETYQSAISGEDIAITTEEYEKLRIAGDEFFRDWCDLVFLTGSRPSEILRAIGSEYKPEYKQICKISHKTLHHGHSRDIVIPEQAEAILVRRIAICHNGYLFATEDGLPPNYSTFSDWFDLAKSKAKLRKEIVPYSLRHGAAVFWLQQGVSIEQVSSWLGHKNIGITQKHYAKLIKLLKGSEKKLTEVSYRPRGLVLPDYPPGQAS